jgi:GTP:adenosylcobinamide-phosphate guanylyltransferase
LIALLWNAIILAASRGPADPIAQHYGLAHKCLLEVGGIPMLSRVVDALLASQRISEIHVSIESADIIAAALGSRVPMIRLSAPAHSAPASALAAARSIGVFPVVITTGDHALLTPEMVSYVCDSSCKLNADITVGLANRETILADYPETKRTYFRFRDLSVSGCNIYTVHSAKGLRLLELWSELEKNRKRPWRLALAFGPIALFNFALGRLSLGDAFDVISRKCDMVARPLILPYAEAAIDVDKPADKNLAEEILERRRR